MRGKLSVVAPLALAAIKRIDAIFDIEREISGLSADERLTVRRGQVAPLVADKRKRLLRHQVGSYLKLCSRLIIRHLSMTFGPSPVEVVGEGFEERLVEDVTRTLCVSATFSFTLHDRTTRATGSTMRESFPARAGSRPPPSRCPSSGGRLDRATIRSDSTPTARSWPVIRRKSINLHRCASRVRAEGEGPADHYGARQQQDRAGSNQRAHRQSGWLPPQRYSTHHARRGLRRRSCAQ